MNQEQKTLIVGLGNPILGDDGAGWQAAEQVRVCLPQAGLQQTNRPTGASPENTPSIEVDCLALGGLSLMERLIGYDRAILIDTILTGQAPVGTLSVVPLESITQRKAGHLSAAHDASLYEALEVGRTMGAHLPEQITVVAIEAEHVYDFSENLTPPVAAAIPQAVQAVLQILESWQTSSTLQDVDAEKGAYQAPLPKR